jgi:YD repeat-containing protein
MAYDKLGRMTQRTEAEGTSTWTYDTKSKGIGKLAVITGPNGYKKELSYDALIFISNLLACSVAFRALAVLCSNNLLKYSRS